MTRPPHRASLRDRGPWARAALIVPVAFIAAVMVHVWLLERFPNSGDEYAYLWQATALAGGSVTAASPQPVESFEQNHLGDVGGRRFSKYTPGWPLLLAFGVFVGVPGLVNPLLAALALAGVYRLACGWAGRRAAWLGTVLIGASPFFLLNAGSYHSHPSCLFALTGLALSLSWAAERPGAWPIIGAGASFGLAVLIRPYTALLVGLPLVAVLGRPLLSAPAATARSMTWFFFGGLPFAVFLAVVNRAATGSWTTLAWTEFDATETLGFASHGHTMWRGIKTSVRLVLEGVMYTSFVTVTLLAAACRAPLARQRLPWILLLAPIVGYVFWWSHGGNRYGPRFYFEGLIGFVPLVGAGLARVLDTRFRKPALTTLAVAIVATWLGLGWHVHAQIDARRDVYRVVEQAGIDRAVVLLVTASADMVRRDLNRNPPDFARAPVLFGSSMEGRDDEVAAAYPDRAVYYYEWSATGGRLRRR